ncbi:LPO_1073/Vpar_1526 family protein, partial [Vibrio anguillarum]
ASIGDSSEKYKPLLKHSYHTVSLLEFNPLTEGALGEKAAKLGYEEQEVSRLKSLFTSNLMNKNEVKDWLVEKVPGLTDLINNWGVKDSSLSKMQLTTVGIALAQANYTRKVNIKFDLGIWVK